MRKKFAGGRAALTSLVVIICIVGASWPAGAQLPDLPLFPLAPRQSESPEVKVSLTPPDAQPGDKVTLAITVKLPAAGYTYSLTTKDRSGTRISIDQAVGLVAIDSEFQPDQPPKVERDPILEKTVEKHLSRVTWSRVYRLEADADPQQVVVKGRLDYWVCDAWTCKPRKEPFEVSLVTGRKPVSNPAAKPAATAWRSVVIPERRGKPEPIELRFELTPPDAKPGDEVTLRVTAIPAAEWHTYAMTKGRNMVGLPTEIKIKALRGLEAVSEDFVPSKPFKVEISEDLPDIEQRVHYGEITWTRKFRVQESAAADGYGIDGSIRYMICRHRTCLPPTTVKFDLGAGAEALATRDNPRADGLIPFLILAAGSGFLALLTPCVFPMVPITVSFFLKQAEKEHHRPVSTALIYCAGIVVAFTVIGIGMAALFGATSIMQLANNPWLNLMIAGVLIFFGLNLLGMFEIRIPSWLLTWTAGRQGQGGVMGVLFMSLTFTLTSFTCTFAFVGFVLVMAAKGNYYWPALGLLAFSAAFALPFFFLALFPSFLQKLPKSGGWMNNVKVTMGLIELGAAFKFLSVADLAWNPVPTMFDYALVMSAWMAILIVMGLYLLGMFRLPHDTPTDSIGVFRLMTALTCLGMSSYLAVGLFAVEKPTGKLWEQIAAFAPPQFGEGGVDDMGPFLKHDGLQYALDFDQAVKYAAARNMPLFLDFTGLNCVNCRLMEKRFEQPHNRDRLEKFVRVQLFTDNVPRLRNDDLVEKLLKRNRDLQENWFGDVSLPSYVVVTPDGKHKLAQFTGLELQDGEFAKFLDAGLEKWQQRQAAGRRPGIALR